MKQCWRVEKSERPTFTTLHEMLQELSTTEDPSSHVSLENIDPLSLCYQPKRKHGAVRESQIVDDEDNTRQDDKLQDEYAFQLQQDARRSHEDEEELTTSRARGSITLSGTNNIYLQIQDHCLVFFI